MRLSFTKLSLPTLALMSLLVLSCKKENSDNSTEGTADITLTYGGQELKVTGPCGWAVASGVHYIGAKHETNNLRVFETSFSIENPPSSTTTYTLVDNQFDENASHAWMAVTEIQGSSFIEWTSFDGSGNVVLVVDGKKVTANLSGITLEPGSNNAAPYNQSGTVSGTLEFYRD